MQSLLKIRYIIIVVFANLIITLCIDPIIFLNENQILYSMSTLAQVIAGLFGLVLAAYAIIDPKLKEIGNQSKQSSDYVDILRDRYFKNIIVLSIMCAITILSALSTLNGYTFLPKKIFSLLINQATIFGVFSIGSFLYFGCSLLNPNALLSLSKEEKKEIENSYESDVADEDFKTFVAYYNKLESLILEFAAELMDKDLQVKQNIKNKNGRIQIFQALDILGMNEIINREIYEKIDELRRYRNALVHSTDDQRVNPQIFNELKKLYERLYAIYTSKDIPDDRNNAIRELYAYGHEISLNQLDEKILDIIKTHDGISARDISAKLQITNASAFRYLKKLISLHKVVQDGNRYYVVK